MISTTYIDFNIENVFNLSFDNVMKKSFSKSKEP